MINTKRELSIRKNESISLLKFAEYLEEYNTILDDVQFDLMTVKTGIKANIVIMLYNVIEATVGQCLDKIHERINACNLKYEELSDDIKKLITVYYGHSINQSNSIDDKMGIVLKLAEFINGNSFINITYKDLAQRYQLYSGNLDSRSIFNVLKKYGIELQQKCTELKTIKDYRNKLAHGEESFEEVGRSLSVQQLSEMVNKTFNYLENMIEEISNYLNEEGFKVRDFSDN